MSIRAMVWALDAPVPDMKAKLVLIALADHADDETFQCWPSVQHISKRLGIHRATVYRAIIYLTDKGLVSHVKRTWPSGSGKQPLFTLLVPPPVAIGDTPVAGERQPCRTAANVKEPSLNLHKERRGNLDLKKEGFKAMPHSPEFLAWKSYFNDRKDKAMLRVLAQRELEGRAFDFETRWPPGHIEAIAA